jgi:hypothetical protein
LADRDNRREQRRHPEQTTNGQTSPASKSTPDANAVAATSTNAIVAITAEPALTSATRAMP